MERAHGRLIGFQMVAPQQTDAAFDTAFEEYELPAAANTLRSDSPSNSRAKGVGRDSAAAAAKVPLGAGEFRVG